MLTCSIWDQPKNVGYSFGYGEETKSSVEAAADFIVFYENWLDLFPEFVGRKLIVAGESYGGHYIPAWANAILDYNDAVITNTKQLEKPEKQKEAKSSTNSTSTFLRASPRLGQTINFGGAVIGNGCVNDTVQNTDEFIKFQHENNLIPADAEPRSYVAAQAQMVSFLGYEPNYYGALHLNSAVISRNHSY